MDEEKLKQGFTPPPTADEVVSEPKKSNIPNSHHYLMIAVIAVIVFLVGGAVVWFYPGTEEIVEEKSLSEEISLYTTKTTICEEQSYDTCNLREEFEKGETILVVTEVIPSIDLDLDVESLYHLEEKLAEYMYTRVERRDPQKQNNPTNLAEFEQNYPNINLRLLFGKSSI